MTIKLPNYEARIAAEQDELQFRYRVAVEALERLADYTATRDRQFDDEIEWTHIAELSGQLRTLAGELTGGDYVRRAA